MRVRTLRSARTARRCVLGGAAALSLAACGSATGAGVIHGRSDARPNHATLTAADLARMPEAGTLFEAVRFMRPMFLQPRPGGSARRGRAPTLAVYINDTYAGGADVLRTIPPSVVDRVRYLQRTEATQFAGSSTAGDGFVMVTLKRAGARP